jgi:predicted phosphodiesterase
MQRIVADLPRTHEILAMSCSHIGSIMCHRSGLEKAIDYIASTKNCYAIHLGDWIESICTDDKRYHAPPDGMRDKEQPIPLMQSLDAISMFYPIRKKLITGLRGNHERKLANFGDLAKFICGELKIPFGTETSRIIIESKGQTLYKIQAMHGSKIFNSNAKDFEKREANKKAALKLYLQEQMGDCAIHLCGHAHWIGIVPPANRLYFLDGASGVHQQYLQGSSASGYINPDQRWFACCGSARKSRLDGYDDYAQNYPPVSLGFVKIIVEDGQIQTLEPFLI